MSTVLQALIEDGLAAPNDAFEGGGFDHTWTAAAGAMPQIAEHFQAAGYTLEMITCQDRREDLAKMRLVYTFNRLDIVDRHLFHADADPGESAPTITGAFKAADWHEREVWDMYGVRFDGHPNLKRLLCPEDCDFHALLKDFGRIEDAP